MTKLDQYKLNGKELVDITGANYCDRPWYESTDDEHGTLMANMILRINPWAKLYVMKLKSYQSNNRRTIYPESAANAILGAIEEDVDIISMSWSIKAMASNQDNKEGTTEPIAIGRLRGAIDEAKKNKIIMFCSASDNIGTASKANLPFTQAPNYIFRIGAADHLGQPDAASEDTSAINYYFPGNKVADSWNPRSLKTVEYHDGSSIATALAAGLASLIMYCVLIVERYRTNYLKDEKKWPSIRKAIRIRDNLKRALDNIDSSSWGGDKRYLPVWDIFGKATTRINEAKSIEDMLYELEVFVTKLCHKVE
ncbi:hypothetical protein GL218_06641 [Daldinia childiae]|uniref:uncharacterized protein n=1 Tax=Daldinia childiae TaxID=326645 RepID=UPI0014469211|nr:uncharacterized protein GL218_06641 [Daldinia childiae]KAF3056360.1 hypothetical protein GL218_06641 [Daldinia childiae]